MNHNDGNLDLLQRGARRIAPMLDDGVLVGGCAVDLLVTEPSFDQPPA